MRLFISLSSSLDFPSSLAWMRFPLRQPRCAAFQETVCPVWGPDTVPGIAVTEQLFNCYCTWETFYRDDILTCHRESTGVNNDFNNGFQGPGIEQAASLSHCNGLLGHLNLTEPLKMLLVTPVPSLWQVKLALVLCQCCINSCLWHRQHPQLCTKVTGVRELLCVDKKSWFVGHNWWEHWLTHLLLHMTNCAATELPATRQTKGNMPLSNLCFFSLFTIFS